MDSYDLVSSLQALPETDPIEIGGIQFSLSLAVTCQALCVVNTLNVLQTICVGTCV